MAGVPEYTVHRVNDDGSKTPIHGHSGTPQSADGWGKALASEKGIKTETINNRTGRTVSVHDKR